MFIPSPATWLWGLASNVLPFTPCLHQASPPSLVTHSSCHDPPQVTVRNGTLQGLCRPELEQEFFGAIPYASPPVRFERPVPAGSWEGVLDTSAYGSACYGTGNERFNQSEDCLLLNIIRPHGTLPDSKLPLMLWLHGGGFGFGSGHVPEEDGRYLVKTSTEMGKPIIFVSVNYRLLIYGYPSGDDALKSGIQNLGYHDQRMAMRWVQENIAAFGGDPSRVSIQGESAGGTAILQHLIIHPTQAHDEHLFSSAIVQSGSFFDMRCDWNISSIRQDIHERFLLDSGCGDWDCLRQMDIDQLHEVAKGYYRVHAPTIDGELIEKHPVELWAEGRFVRVPLMMGTNQDEGTGISGKGCNTDQDVLDAIARDNATSYVIREEAFPALLQAYPDDPREGSPGGTGRATLPSGLQDKRVNAMATDALVGAARRWIVGLMADAGVPTYSYYFRQWPYMGSILSGVTHYAEIPYVFGDPTGTKFEPGNKDDVELSETMRRAWISFAHSHDPNHDKMAHWPDYKRARENMEFVSGGVRAEKDDWRKEGMDVWIRERIKGCSGLRP